MISIISEVEIKFFIKIPSLMCLFTPLGLSDNEDDNGNLTEEEAEITMMSQTIFGEKIKANDEVEDERFDWSLSFT